MILMFLAACDRSPSPDESVESLNEDSRPQSMEVEATVRSGHIVLTKFWWDGDRDGYGVPGSSLWATKRPRHYAPRGGDCADRDATVNPAATEVEGDGVDNDCDGNTDEPSDTGTSDSGTDTGSSDDTASGTDSGTSGTDTGTADSGVTGDTGTDTATSDTGGTSSDTGVTPTGILVYRDTTDGLTYPADIYAWYGESTTSSASVNSESEYLEFSPTDAELSNHSWVDIQASWDSGASWSDDCSGFTVTSSDYTVALYENTASTATNDTCRIYVGLAVPYGSDAGAWTAVP